MKFEILVNHHKEAVLVHLLRICGNRTDAEDALGEAILEAYEHKAELRSLASLKSWLLTVATRKCLRIKARPGTAAIPEDGHSILRGADGSANTEFEDWETWEIVHNAVGDLPHIHAEILALMVDQNMSALEAAAQLGISEGAAKARLHRARKAVQGRLRFMTSQGKGQPPRN